MREDIQIRPIRIGLETRAGGQAFAISFRYSDPDKALRVVRELVRRVIEAEETVRLAVVLNRGDTARNRLDLSLLWNLEQLDPPSGAVRPWGPDKLGWPAGGSALGLLFGTLTLRFRRGRASPDLLIGPAQ